MLVLLEAIEQLPHSSAARVLVAGDGPLRPAVEAAVSRLARVEYVGHQTDVLPIYRQADVVLIPSFSEGHPLTALEAMACGLPVAASSVGGLRETVIDGVTGLLPPPGDAGALARALVRLERDPEGRRAMGAAGRRRVEEQFSVERMLDQVAEVYREVLG